MMESRVVVVIDGLMCVPKIYMNASLEEVKV